MKRLRSTITLAFAMAALGAVIVASLVAPARPRIISTMEGHKG